MVATMSARELVQQNLKAGRYTPLPEPFRTEARESYMAELPDLDENKPLLTRSGVVIATGFTRIVIGDYGAYLEFSREQARYLHIKPSERYRTEPYWKARVKFIWYEPVSGEDVKVYWQLRTVAYADYRPGYFYVSPHEVMQ